MLKKLSKLDTRLPTSYQKGGHTGTSHVSLRIYDEKVKGSAKIPQGGSRMFHVGYHYHHSIGCEVLGEKAKFYKGIKTSKEGEKAKFEDIYMVRKTGTASFNFMDNIIKVYEDNVKLESDKQSVIEIDIRVDFNIIENLTKSEEIDPKETYHKLYPKIEPIAPLKPKGITPIIQDLEIPHIEIPNNQN